MVKYVFGGDDVEVRRGLYPRLVKPGSEVKVFRDAQGTVPATGLRRASDDTQVTKLEVTVDSQLPTFYLSVDDLPVVYVSINGGGVTPVKAHPIPGNVPSTGGGSGGPTSWEAITGKPATFPASPHSHDWESVTGKPTTYPAAPHNHWWADINDKPTSFPPAAHNHDGVYAPVDHAHPWASITGKPDTYVPSVHQHAWADITGKPTVFPPDLHNHAISDVTGLSEALADAGGGPVETTIDPSLAGLRVHYGFAGMLPNPAEYPNTLYIVLPALTDDL